MCRLIALSIVLTVLVFIASLVAAARYIGWWAVPLVLIAWALVAKWAAKRAVMRLAFLPLTIKGRVLRNAQVELHGIDYVADVAPPRTHDPIDADAVVRAETVGPIGALPSGEDDEAAGEPEIHTPEPEAYAPRIREKRYVRVDVTITPHHGVSRVRVWEPGELVLVPYGARMGVAAAQKQARSPVPAGQGAAEPVAVEARVDGRWMPAQGMHHDGPLRVRLTYAIASLPEGDRMKFRYYFEGLGDFRLGSPERNHR